MNKKIKIRESYLYIPIYTGCDSQKIMFSIKGEMGSRKIFELMIPVDQTKEEEYFGDYLAEIPVQKYIGQEMEIEGDFPFIMGMRIENSKKRHQYVTHRPKIHFTVNRGWSNDPNGLVYKDGLYHMYFQYNPFDLKWENMSWGHAISRDLLHWAQLDTVMFPDEDGSIFSGCGLVNHHALLDLPKDALLFFYTAAGGCNAWSKGKEFTQKIAYSTNMGETLTKMSAPCIDTIYRDNRDPKIFWHSDSNAYVLVLWLKGNEFGIFRSTDLKNWIKTQDIFLEDGWECPDLFCLSSEDGGKKWFFWSADGYYFPGEFDGYTFSTTGERHKAYLSKLPYAAQTFSGVEDRMISIPWLRMENDGRLFIGSFGIPVELSYTVKNNRTLLLQRPVRELLEHAIPVREENLMEEKEYIIYCNHEKDAALYGHFLLSEKMEENHEWIINDTKVSYNQQTGILYVGEEKFQAGPDFKQMEMIIDDCILEVFFDQGIRMGTFALKSREVACRMSRCMCDHWTLQEIL